MSINRLVVVFAIALSSAAARADAATFTVDSNADESDAILGDGICADASGGCTLRAAVEESNALPGADAVDIPAGTITLSPTGYVAVRVTDDLQVTGAGRDLTIIDGNRNGPPPQWASSVLFVAEGATVVIRDLTLQHGRAYGGGLDNAGNTTLIGVAVRANVSPNVGGGVQNQPGGTLALLGCLISGNASVNVGGGVYNEGSLTIVASTFTGNAAGNSGGGLHSDRGATILTSTFVGNYAGNVGGGLSTYGATTLANCTLSGNSAGNTGGGAHIDGSLTVNNGTITANSAGNVGGGISVGDGASASIRNTILHGNSSRFPDCQGDVASGGNNVIGSLTGCALVPGAGDQVGVDPLLGPLQDNGGPTATHALGAASPALDAGGSACEIADQRGIARPQGAACDVGAYELARCNNDGVLDPGEDCDDGNLESGDGCTATCQTEMLAGASLRLSGEGADARLISRARDRRVRLGWGNLSGDDPVLHGATLRVRGAAGQAFDRMYDLPAANWSYLGKVGRNRGYRYRDDLGAIRMLLVQPGKQIRIKGAGVGLGMAMDLDPAPVDLVLSLGERSYCSSYGGQTRYRAGRDYRARNAPAPPEPPL